MAIINNRNIANVRDGFNRYFPEGVPEKSFVDGSFSSGEFRWLSRKYFIDFVADEVKVYIDLKKPDFALIKEAQQKFEQRALTPEKATEENMPKDLEKLKADDAAREAERQKITKESNETVRKAIEKQKEIHDKLSETKPKIYAKTQDPEKPELSETALKNYNNLKIKSVEYLKEHPNESNPSIPNIAQKIEKSISPSVKGQLTQEQIHLIALDSAYKAVDAANNPEKYIEMARQAAILKAVAADNAILSKTITDNEILGSVQVGARELSVFNEIQTQTPRVIWDAFDKELGDTLFPDSNDFQVNLSETPSPGYTTTFSPDGMVQGYTDFLTNNLDFFQKISGLPLDKFQGQLTAKASGWLESQIAANFPDAARMFATPEAQALLESLGVGTITIELPASMGAFFIENSAALPALNFLSSGMGVSFSVGSVTTGAAIQTAGVVTAESVAVSGGVMAGEAFLGGAAAAGAGAAGGAAGGVAAGAAAGSVVPGVGTAIGAVVGAVVGPKVIKLVKDTVSKNKGAVAKIAVGIAGLGIGASIGLSAGMGAITGGIIGGLGGYGVGSLISGGASGLSSTLSGVGSSVSAVAGAIWGTFLAGIGAPILAFLIGFPVVVALILFIINTGAYVVPPGDQAVSSTNPYISVVKEANPSGQLSSPTSITYTVTITAKKDTLTGITMKADCRAIREVGTIDCPPEQIPNVPESINAGTPFSFTFTLDFGSQYQDSLVSNTITVTAVSPSGGQVSETGSASVCFGKCPLDCFAFPDQYWPSNSDVQNLKSLLTGAASRIAGEQPNFAAKVCAEGTVNLCYNPGKLSGGIFGYHEHGGACDIDFNTKVAAYGTEGTYYLLVHEATHHIQTIDGYYRSVFDDTVASAEPSICTYGGNNPDESMAEGSGLYVAKPVIYANAGCVPNYQSKYPRHYNFAKNCLFAASCNP